MPTQLESLRQDAVDIFQQGIDAANPYHAVKKCLVMVEGHLEIALSLKKDSKKRIGKWQKIHVIAFGKAAVAMAKAVKDVVPNHYIANTILAITNYENKNALGNIDALDIEVIGAAHPLPDISGLKATKTIVERLKKTKRNELVLVLISGGGSALISYPAVDITLDDKIATTELLLASGTSINQINCIRKHLSQIKGGHLAKLATPSDLHALILSDVVGDDLSTIASGATVPDQSTFADAIKILNEKQIWNKIPLSVQKLLEKGNRGEIEETPKENELFFNQSSHTLIGSNTISLDAVIHTAKEKNYKIYVFSYHLSGEAREIATQLLCYANEQLKQDTTQVTAILCGGETTVTVKGTGLGGRNQEMALAFAIAAEKAPIQGKWVFLCGGTDGRDGATDAAGGLVDSETLEKMTKLCLKPKEYLENNDSYSILKQSQNLLITGATGTNVADLQILLIWPNTI